MIDFLFYIVVYFNVGILIMQAWIPFIVYKYSKTSSLALYNRYMVISWLT